MRLNSLFIDGFGVYHRQGIPRLPEGLVLFLGGNEDGKTTLMEFIRGVLFGFRRKDDENPYQPLRGGNHGGRLQVVMADGRIFTIQRLEKTVTILGEDGAAEKAEPSARLLQGLDRLTFEHVFAVGLEELQGLGVLGFRDVKDRLFSASAGLGSASVPRALASLDKALDALATVRGRTQKILLLKKELKEKSQQLKALKGEARLYADTTRRRERLEEENRRLQQEARALRKRLRRLEQLAQAREPWTIRNRNLSRAQELEFARNFPTDGLARWEELGRVLEGLAQESALKEGEAAELREQLAGLLVDERVWAQGKSILRLYGEKEKLASVLEELPGAAAGVRQAEETFRRRLRELGPDWDARRLEEADLSVAVRQAVQEYGRRLDAALRQEHDAAARLMALSEAAADAAAEARRAGEALAALPPAPVSDAQELRAREEAFRQVRVLFQEGQVLQADARALDKEQADHRQRLGSLQKRLLLPDRFIPWWPGLTLAVFGLALAGLRLTRLDYLEAGITAAMSVAFGALWLLARRRNRQDQLQKRAELEEELNREEARSEALAQERQDLVATLAATRERLADHARRAGCAPPATAQELENRAAALAGVREEWEARQRAQDLVDRIVLKRNEVSRRLDRGEAELAEVRREAAAVQEEWGSWLSARGFAPTVRPEGFETVLTLVEAARSALNTLEERRLRHQQLTAYLDGMRRRLQEIAQACGLSFPAATPAVADLEALHHSYTAADAARQRREHLERALAAVEQENARLQKQQAVKEQARQQLLEQAGATDEEDFRQRAGAYRQWRECLQKVEAAETALLTVAAQADALAALAEDLAAADPLALEEERESGERRLQEMTAAMDDNHQEIGRLTERLKDLAGKEELGEVLLEERCLREELARAARRWAALALCRHLVEETRRLYERERQPPVIQEADAFFRTMTGGRYHLVAAVGESTIRLEDDTLGAKGEITWSAGLADQVYLSLRLGLAREFGRHAEPLPVILDDVLVKFDPRRRQEAARVILDFSRQQQVLFFSCHEEYRFIFSELARQFPEPSSLLTVFTITDGVIARL